MTTLTLAAVLHSPIAHAALAGALTAAAVDFQAFRTWHTFHDFVSYNWGTALFRWFQGAVIGAATAAGVGQFL